MKKNFSIQTDDIYYYTFEVEVTFDLITLEFIAIIKAI